MKNVLACRAIGGEGTFGLNRSQRPDVVWVCDHGRHCQRSLGEGVVTLSKTSLILAIEQQAKSLKSHATTLTFIGEFRSI
jgi:hypothetical protein